MCNENVADGLTVMHGSFIIDQFDAGSTDFVANLSCIVRDSGDELVPSVGVDRSAGRWCSGGEAAGAIVFIAAKQGGVYVGGPTAVAMVIRGDHSVRSFAAPLPASDPPL